MLKPENSNCSAIVVVTCDLLMSKIGDREARLRRTDVDAGHEPVARVELHRRRAAPAPRGAGPEIGDDAALDQMSAQRSDGGRRQARRRDDFGSREWAGAIDRTGEHAIEVERSKVSRVARVDVDVVTLRVAQLSSHACENSL